MSNVVQLDFHDEVELGRNLAFPPLYVLRAVERCPECGRLIHVYALGCAAYQDAEEGHTIEVFHFLHHIRSVPARLLEIIAANCRGFRFDGDGERYLLNHCSCGTALDDEMLHGDVGAVFFPDTPDAYAQFRVFRLPIDAPIEIDSSYSIGGGEYLAFDKTEAW